MKKLLAIAATLGLGACATMDAPRSTPAEAFFTALSQYCGQAFEGRITSTDEADDDWRGQRMVMHVRECSDDEIRIPLHVGENRSRTWIVSRTGNGLRLKHDHRHEDGSDDAVTMYGGDTRTPGLEWRQEFPVDDFSIAMFEREGLSASVTNVWAMELQDDRFVYELRRPPIPGGRHFRAEFDLAKPVIAPPPPWGSD